MILNIGYLICPLLYLYMYCIIYRYTILYVLYETMTRYYNILTYNVQKKSQWARRLRNGEKNHLAVYTR